MAHNKKTWDEARAYFEQGKPLSFIAGKTGISSGALSKKSKKETWSKEKGKQLVLDEVRLTEEKEAKSEQELEIHNSEVNRLLRHRKKTDAVANLGQSLIGKKFKEEGTKLTMLDIKNGIDANDKASVTIGVNARHAPKTETTIHNTNAQQNNVPPNEILDAIRRKHRA